MEEICRTGWDAGLKNAVLAVLCVACLAGSVTPGWSAGHSRNTPFTVPFTYYAERQALPQVLTSFANSQRYSAVVAPSVSGTMSGRFENVPPATFLETLRAAFGISWYRLGRSLHFYNESESSRTFIAPRVIAPVQLRAMLQRAAVLSPDLPVSMGPSGDMIVLTGPPGYLSQVNTAVASFEAAQAGNTVMRVFSLKYAWADDLSVRSQDKTVVIPGVATILRAMVAGVPPPPTVQQNTATVGKLGGTGLIAQGRAPSATSAEAAPTAPTAPAVPTANIIADARVNSVVVHDAEYRMPYYRQVIADLDKPVALVEIHAAIVDIDTNFSRTLGVSYEGMGKINGNWSVGGTLSSENSPSSGMNLSTVYTRGTDYFLANVQALEEKGEARMLGRPSVLTMDNMQASLENITTYYLQVAGYETVDLFKVEAGTVLRVTPHIISDEQGRDVIKMAVSVEDNQNSDSPPSGGTGALPPIKQTRINTQAIIGTGQSLLIGGYYYEQKGVSKDGIPILMDIPLLGHLFKTTSNTSKQMQRMFLITPKIVQVRDLPPLPTHVDDPTFHVAPTQTDYAIRTPAPQSGCSRRPATFTPTSPSTAPAPASTSVQPLSMTAPSAPVRAAPTPPALSTTPSPQSSGRSTP